ncbi:DUF1671 domain containing protein [Niveomyces insectorum RCEF 264]|uniref:DUF1671 domain containing protein n=1 Tax=Niveomyces insectorum RCEF 264 TaxID=1081102 RepID=A0A167X7E8_9HYPO|nr:DUF1671 domain containing protein [Niveomyces insectorum RCEF 264]
MTQQPQRKADDANDADGEVEEATLKCPLCDFTSVEYGLSLHMDVAHAEGQPSPAGGARAEGGGGTGNRAADSAPSRVTSTSTGGRGMLRAVSSAKRTAKRAKSAAAAAPRTPVSPHNGVGTSSSDNHDGSGRGSDGLGSGGMVVGNAGVNGKVLLADCPVRGCGETLPLAELAYHVDLHVALEYQESLGDEEDILNGVRVPIDDTSRSASASTSDNRAEKTNGQEKPTTTITPSTKRNGGPTAGSTHPRSSSVPPASRPPQPASTVSTDSTRPPRHTEARKRRSTLTRASSTRESRPANASEHSYERKRRSSHARGSQTGRSDRARGRGDRPDRSDHSIDHRDHRDQRDQRDHRNRRHRRTRDERRRDRNRGHGSESDWRARAPADTSQTTSVTQKPSATLRSWLSVWLGLESKKAAAPRVASRSNADATPNNGKSAQPREASETKETRPPPQRLGKAELGKYALEDRMPDELAIYLKKEWGVCDKGIIPVLKQLLEQSPSTDYVYLCDPCVQHVSRLPKEGGFCGYRNIQTMISYIVGAHYPGYKLFSDDLPSVFDIQNLVENAWDMGINAQARIETGGIRLTRKYIGTPEALALFQSLNIPCSIRAFRHKVPGKSADMLLRDVEQYFEAGNYQPGRKVRATTLPPIFWQHPGHSLTIVGIEKTKTGQTNLLVFDPILRNGLSVVRLVGRRHFEHHFPDALLRGYRRGPRYLARFEAFEILK